MPVLCSPISVAHTGSSNCGPSAEDCLDPPSLSGRPLLLPPLLPLAPPPLVTAPASWKQTNRMQGLSTSISTPRSPFDDAPALRTEIRRGGSGAGNLTPVT